MTESIGWGILGPGGIAEMQVADLLQEGLSVVAVGSRSLASAQTFADRHSIPAAYGSYAELVADPAVDIVYVATPHPFHEEHALLAINAGKHVLIEKPITMNRDQAARVVEAGRAKGVLVLEAMWTRFLPHMVRIRESIAAGELGELRSLVADHGQLLPSDPAHRINDPALGGGALLDLGIYPISFAHDLFGTPTRTRSSAVFGPTGVDTLASVVLEFEGGCQAIAHFGSDALGPNRASIVGTLGRIDVDGVWYSRTSFTRYDAKNEIIERFESDYEGRGMQFQAFEAERLIRAGLTESELISLDESVTIMGTLDAIRDDIGLRYPGLD